MPPSIHQRESLDAENWKESVRRCYQPLTDLRDEDMDYIETKTPPPAKTKITPIRPSDD